MELFLSLKESCTFAAHLSLEISVPSYGNVVRYLQLFHHEMMYLSIELSIFSTFF